MIIKSVKIVSESMSRERTTNKEKNYCAVRGGSEAISDLYQFLFIYAIDCCNFETHCPQNDNGRPIRNSIKCDWTFQFIQKKKKRERKKTFQNRKDIHVNVSIMSDAKND